LRLQKKARLIARTSSCDDSVAKAVESSKESAKAGFIQIVISACASSSLSHFNLAAPKPLRLFGHAEGSHLNHNNISGRMTILNKNAGHKKKLSGVVD